MKLRLVLAGLLVLIIALSLPGQAVAAPPPESKALRLIIQVEPGADTGKLVRDYDGRLRHSFPDSMVSVSLSENKFDRLRGDFRVKSVRPEVRVQATQDILDWGVDRIDAEKVWGGSEDATNVIGGRNAGDGIKVAIIDTGIDYNHPDLAANYQGGYDFANTDADPMDDNGHGTHVAGIVAASDNNSGVIGVAPKAYLYGVKVLDSRGRGWESDVAAGIWWCIDNGIQIISMSLGSDYNMPLVAQACDAADNAGLLLVAAAGNDGLNWRAYDTVDYPAKYDSVIAVGATDQDDARATFSRWFGSSTGPDVELAAPGKYIYSAYWDNTYATLSGTSMACPMVTGTAALVWRAYPGYTNAQVRQRLQNTAEDLGTAGRDWVFGFGLVDAEAAATTSSADAPPTVSIVNPANGATISGNVSIQVSASDDEGVDTVEYRIDNGAYEPMVYAPGYWEATWDSTTAEDGSHTLTAKATDTIGQESTNSIAVTVDNADNPPTVNITSPPDGDFVSGTIAITASASDDKGVSQVEFYIDGTSLATDNAVPYECYWNTATASDGSYAIKAVATDTTSQTAQNTVMVTVDNTEPVVTVVEPTEGTAVSGTITIKASVTEANIDKVEYQIDGGSLASMTYNAPYWEASWDSTTAGNGAHTVTVRATDRASNPGSGSSSFTVDNQGLTMHVASLEMNLVQRVGGRLTYATATATVVDATGNPVEGVRVSGHWEGASTGMGYGITNASGQVTLRSRTVRYPTSGTSFTFVIESITKNGWTYDPSANSDFNGDGTPGDIANSITVP